MKFYARKSWGNFTVDLFGYEKRESGMVDVIQQVSIKSFDQNELTDSIPMMSIDIEDAQRLVDALWDAGLRPSEGTGSAGSLAKTEAHLSDMRALVSHTIGVKLQ